MVRYGKHGDKEDIPSSMHIKRIERKYRTHKLAKAIGYNYAQRKHE